VYFFKGDNIAIELLSVSPEVILLIIWILLFNWWFKSESEDMTVLLGIIFMPYSVFFCWYALPTLSLTHWMVYFFFISVGLIVITYSLDVKYKWRGKK